jgi:hypothetical protein
MFSFHYRLYRLMVGQITFTDYVWVRIPLELLYIKVFIIEKKKRIKQIGPYVKLK